MNDETSHIKLQQPGPIPLDVEFNCQKGEIFVLVGPSGSGKTTTLRSIAGLYRPRSGRISCHGNTWFDSKNDIHVPVQQRAVGLVFQHYALFPHLTVRDNIAIALNKVNGTNHKTQLKQLIEMVHLTGLEQRHPHKLSGGQQQRVALARALARQPEILLLDEPFSAVDQQTRRHLVRELVQLRNRLHIPIIHVTHNLNEARRIADTICIMDEGKTLQTGTPTQVMNTPLNARVAGLTGHDNIFSGAVHAQDRDEGKTLIQWYEHLFETAYRPEFAANEIVDWMIPASHIHLHRQTEQSSDHRNKVSGSITEYVQLGEGSFISIIIDGTDKELHLNVSTHIARNEGLSPGTNVTVSLSPDSIHLMKSV